MSTESSTTFKEEHADLYEGTASETIKLLEAELDREAKEADAEEIEWLRQRHELYASAGHEDLAEHVDVLMAIKIKHVTRRMLLDGR